MTRQSEERRILRAALEALSNVPVVGEVYDQQHSDTHMRASLAIRDHLAGAGPVPRTLASELPPAMVEMLATWGETMLALVAERVMGRKRDLIGFVKLLVTRLTPDERMNLIALLGASPVAEDVAQAMAEIHGTVTAGLVNLDADVTAKTITVLNQLEAGVRESWSQAKAAIRGMGVES